MSVILNDGVKTLQQFDFQLLAYIKYNLFFFLDKYSIDMQHNCCWKIL